MSFVGVFFWFGESWYFGWNRTAQSTEEIIADMLVLSVIILAFFIRPTSITKEITMITTDTVEINGKPILKIKDYD